jgi:hypothetical protein
MDEESREKLSKLIAERYPQMAKKAFWFERGVILRTDSVAISEVRAAFELSSVKGPKPVLTSGSIAKLKKAVSV